MSRFGVTGILSHPGPTTSDLECSSSKEWFHYNLEIQSLSETTLHTLPWRFKVKLHLVPLSFAVLVFSPLLNILPTTLCLPRVLELSLELFLGEGNGTHSSTLAWKIPWMEEPGRLQSMGSRRVGHNWATSLSLFTFMHWRRKWQPTPVFLPRESQEWGSLLACRLWGCTELDTTEVT